jgi:hypothetical protein
MWMAASKRMCKAKRLHNNQLMICLTFFTILSVRVGNYLHNCHKLAANLIQKFRNPCFSLLFSSLLS